MKSMLEQIILWLLVVIVTIMACEMRRMNKEVQNNKDLVQTLILSLQFQRTYSKQIQPYADIPHVPIPKEFGETR